MSHIHLPDGMLPVYWWATGTIISFVIILVLLKRLKMEDVRRRVPFVGILAAFMLITMSVPLGIIPVHLSLAVLCGILAGPGLGFLAVVVVNVMLAFFGHGGITVVGINTLILGSEVALGSYIYRFLSNRIRNTPAILLSVIISLLVSIVLMIVVVSSTVGLVEVLPHSHDIDGDAHMGEGTDLGDAYVSGEDDDELYSESVVEVDSGNKAEPHAEGDAQLYDDTVFHSRSKDLELEVSGLKYLFFSGWSALFAILLAGIAIEATVTVLVVNFFLKVRPDLVIGSKGLTNNIP